ncbi:MAG TPA: DUF72 domain-containing protein [Candidatus Binatia bacterium]|nr:DUF72 domain-containing protein [Candidatus Binatia bacterium]
MSGTLYVGTSGFAYKTWKPGFYPEKLKAAQMLRFYSERLPSVEINNTFYRMPSEKLLAGWREETPQTFRFTLKAPQRITHIGRLRDVGDPLRHFLDTARTLGPRLGCVLFQCPPYLRYDAALIESFLAELPREGMRFAMEFRHPSWDEAREALAARSIAWTSVDGEEHDAEPESTAADFVYLRLRKPAYDEAALAAWTRKLRPLLERGMDVYLYFKHEDDPGGVEYARSLIAGI